MQDSVDPSRVEHYLQSAKFQSGFRQVDNEIGKAMLSYQRGVETRAYSEEQAAALKERILTEGIDLLVRGYVNHLQSAIERGHSAVVGLLFRIAEEGRDEKSYLDNAFMVSEDGNRERVVAVYQRVLDNMCAYMGTQDVEAVPMHTDKLHPVSYVPQVANLEALV